MKPKLKDVAAEAGVSVATASLVLSGKGRISDDAKQKVLAAVDKLGYEKKRRNSFPAGGENIGIFYSIDYEWAFIWSFIRPIIDEIEANMKAMGYNTVIIPIKRANNRDEIIGKLKTAKICAVVSLHFGDEELFTELEKDQIPVVVVMNGNFQDKFYSVCVDDYQGAYEGTSHLIKLGHSRIAYVDSDRPDLPMLLNDRFIGFRKAMEENKLAIPEEFLIHFDLSDMDMLREKIETALASSGRPTAIFCLDDEIALRVIIALGRLGLGVPDQVSVIAPGDVLDYNQHYYPRITTMRINTTYMGKIISQMMQNRIQHKPEDIHVLKVKQQLMERGSCRTLGG